MAVGRRRLVPVRSIPDTAPATVLPLPALAVDTNGGFVRGRLKLPFWSRGPYYTVVYVAGWGVPTPPAFNSAARITLDDLWETQHGPSTRPSMAGEEMVEVSPGFLIPRRAYDLMAPYALETSLG